MAATRGPTVPSRALAIYAHPDDPEVACAGTLAAWAAAGCALAVVSLARGEKGGRGDRDELAGRREREARAAAEIVGAERWETFGLDDGSVDNTAELRARLVRLIRSYRPEVVLTSDPTAVFFGDRYVNHRDHRETGWAVLDAVAPAAANGSYFPDAGPPHQVDELYLSGTLEPNHWVDIASSIEVKIAALRCHHSQLVDALEGQDLAGDDEVVAAVVRARAATDGAAAGMVMAESFRRLLLGGSRSAGRR
jgi:LmbE family N-acetylglucosaminyl deacetylase